MEYRNELVRVGMLISLITGAVLIGILIVYRHPHVAAARAGVRGAGHVVADADGTHLEAVVPEPEQSRRAAGSRHPSGLSRCDAGLCRSRC